MFVLESFTVFEVKERRLMPLYLRAPGFFVFLLLNESVSCDGDRVEQHVIVGGKNLSYCLNYNSSGALLFLLSVYAHGKARGASTRGTYQLTANVSFLD